MRAAPESGSSRRRDTTPVPDRHTSPPAPGRRPSSRPATCVSPAEVGRLAHQLLDGPRASRAHSSFARPARDSPRHAATSCARGARIWCPSNRAGTASRHLAEAPARSRVQATQRGADAPRAQPVASAPGGDTTTSASHAPRRSSRRTRSGIASSAFRERGQPRSPHRHLSLWRTCGAAHGAAGCPTAGLPLDSARRAEETRAIRDAA